MDSLEVLDMLYPRTISGPAVGERWEISLYNYGKYGIKIGLRKISLAYVWKE